MKYADLAKISHPLPYPPPSRERDGWGGLSHDVINQVEIQTKYKGYIQRQADSAERFKKIEEKQIPEGFIYKGIPGLSKEIVEKLEEVKPFNLGQAGRIPGVTPAAISLLMVAVERHRRMSLESRI